jgi:hypothetical protein
MYVRMREHDRKIVSHIAAVVSQLVGNRWVNPRELVKECDSRVVESR